MNQIQYKFKSSINYETVNFESKTITVKKLKDQIFEKNRHKLSGFDISMKLKTNESLDNESDEIYPGSNVIVTRIPKQKSTNNENYKQSVNSSEKCPNTLPKPPIKIVSVDRKPKEILEQIVNEELNFYDTQANISDKEDDNSDNIQINPPDYMLCTLCEKVMKNSSRIKCCNTDYCSSCINGFLFDPDISGCFECPNCKSVTPELIENVQIKQEIEKFKTGQNFVKTLDEINKNTKICDSVVENIQEDQSSNLYNYEKFNNCNELNDVNPITATSKNIDADCDKLTRDLYDLEDDFVINEVILTNGEVSTSNDNNTNNKIDCYNNNNKLNKTDSTKVNDDSDKYSQKIETILRRNISPKIKNSTKPGNCELSITTDNSTVFNDNNSAPNSFNEDISPPFAFSDLNVNSDDIPSNSNNINTFENIQEEQQLIKQIPISSLDFDPVLYMQFLTCMSKSYPDELQAILSEKDNRSHSRNKPPKEHATRLHKHHHRTYRDEVTSTHEKAKRSTTSTTPAIDSEHSKYKTQRRNSSSNKDSNQFKKQTINDKRYRHQDTLLSSRNIRSRSRDHHKTHRHHQHYTATNRFSDEDQPIDTAHDNYPNEAAQMIDEEDDLHIKSVDPEDNHHHRNYKHRVSTSRSKNHHQHNSGSIRNLDKLGRQRHYSNNSSSHGNDDNHQIYNYRGGHGDRPRIQHHNLRYSSNDEPAFIDNKESSNHKSRYLDTRDRHVRNNNNIGYKVRPSLSSQHHFHDRRRDDSSRFMPNYNEYDKSFHPNGSRFTGKEPRHKKTKFR